uniref:HCLS1-associated protein X-1 n=2 Tax=Arion vulgaris TaxID=1028688 RepID=A0A0B7BC29_9EUPU
MDSRDFFRRFFGFPNRHPTDFVGNDDDEFPRDEHNHPDFEFNVFFDDGSRGLAGMFEHFHGDMWRQMEALHKQMDEMTKGFGVIDFPSFFGRSKLLPLDQDEQGKHVPDEKGFFWSSPPNPFFKRDDKRNPRDFMLKEGVEEEFHPENPSLPAPPTVDGNKSKFDEVYTVPHWNTPGSQNKGDTDLDGKFSEDRILEMIQQPKQQLPKKIQPSQDKPKIFSSRKHVSVSTVRGLDNKVEHKRTVRNSSGHEENTVTRSIGDKSYSVTTVTEKDGTQTRHETFQNMDDKDVSKFEEEWNKKPQRHPTSDLTAWPVPTLDKEDRNIFSKLFDFKK